VWKKIEPQNHNLLIFRYIILLIVLVQLTQSVFAVNTSRAQLILILTPCTQSQKPCSNCSRMFCSRLRQPSLLMKVHCPCLAYARKTPYNSRRGCSGRMGGAQGGTQGGGRENTAPPSYMCTRKESKKPISARMNQLSEDKKRRRSAAETPIDAAWFHGYTGGLRAQTSTRFFEAEE